MCGIVAYVGPQPARDVVLAGLAAIWNTAATTRQALPCWTAVWCTSGARLERCRTSRSCSRPIRCPQGGTGLGHTRWATHGGPTDENAHPQLDCAGALALIHNGVIENHADLRARLLKDGHTFRSQTDTEVAAHLLEEAFAACGDLAESLRRVCRSLDGSFSFVAVHRDAPGLVVGARRNSPLVRRRRRRRDVPCAAMLRRSSRTPATRSNSVKTRLSRSRADKFEVTTFAGDVVDGRHYHVDWDLSAAEKGGYDYFMLKEIAEQPDAVAATLLGRLTHDGALMLDEMRLDESTVARASTRSW